MTAQERRYSASVAVVFSHSYREGLQPAQHQPGIQWAGHTADRVLQKGQLLEQVVSIDDQRPTDEVAVAAKVLGRAVDHDVGPQLERPLEVRTHEGVVDDDKRVPRMGQVTNGPDIDQFEQRI